MTLGAAGPHEHIGPARCARLGKDEHRRLQEGGWTCQRGHPQEKHLSAGSPLGWLLHGVILTSHGSTFSMAGAGRDQPVFLTASPTQPRGCLTHGMWHRCSEQLVSVGPTDEGHHARVDTMDVFPSGLGIAHLLVLSVWQRVKV